MAIKELFLKAFNRLLNDKETIIQDFNAVKDEVFNTTELEAERSELQIEINEVAELVEKCINQNAHSALNQEEYKKHYERLVGRYDEVKSRLEQADTEITERQTKKKMLELFLSNLARQSETVTEFSAELWYSMVDFVTVYSDEDIRFTFKNGAEITVK